MSLINKIATFKYQNMAIYTKLSPINAIAAFKYQNQESVTNLPILNFLN